MRKIVIGRLGGLVGVLFALTIAVFVIQAVLPADPVRAYVGASASPSIVAEKRHELGYDRPIVVQYVDFLGRLFRGDLGTSLRTRHTVTEDLGHFAPATIELALAAAVLAGVLGLALGMWSARRGRGSGVARAIMVALSSTPTFLLAILLILLFYSRLGLLPASGRLTNDQTTDGPTGLLTLDALLHLDFPEFGDAVQHLVIPALCLAVGPAVAIARVLRSSLIEVLNQDYVRTAQAKGLSNWTVLRRHGLRNAVGPALSMAGLQVGLLLTGVVVIELVLAWPGLGLYTTQAITSADFPAVTGVVLVLGLAYVVINAVVDVLQMIADPRLRTGATS